MPGIRDIGLVELELGLAEDANQRLQVSETALASRDRLISSALEAGAPVAEVARRLEMTEQAIYQIRDRLERGAPLFDHLAATRRAMEDLTDHQAFELACVELLHDLDPSLRHLGGSGDRARDAGGGAYGPDGDERLVMVSLEKRWSQKIRRELERVAREGWSPTEVWAVTSRRTSPKPRDALIEEAARRGWHLRVFDQTWLASRLLQPEHLDLRERLLGLAPPRPPTFLGPAQYAAQLAGRARTWPDFMGREPDLKGITDALEVNPLVIVRGPGGIGKTRLAIELARVHPARWVFVDSHATLDSAAMSEIAGGDDLVAVIDNAHRRDDLSALIGMLDRRAGSLRVILLSRPGFEEQLIEATSDSRVGSPAPHAVVRLAPLSPAAIADLLRSPPLDVGYRGAVEAIVRLCEGNPQIAILAAELSKGGVPVEAISQDDLLQNYVAQLLASATGAAHDPDGRVVREVLALVAAFGRVGRDEDELLEQIAHLTELGRRPLMRILADLADTGLLEDSRDGYCVTPDLLAEHVLLAAFFSSKWRPTIAYSEVWRPAPPQRMLRLVKALGRIPPGSAMEDHPAFQTPRRDLLAHAESSNKESIASAMTMAREIAGGAPRLAVEMVDRALTRLPSPGDRRDQVLSAACDAIERVGMIDIGWPRQLAVAAATYAAPAGETTTTAVTKALISVYQRVPVDTGGHDGALLAAVQRALAQLTRAYWTSHGTESGVAQAVAVASRALLTVTFESHFMPADDPKSVLLRGYALPASSHTDTALTTGAELFCETFWMIPEQLQLEQLEALAGLRRTEKGFPGPFNVQPSEQTRELALKALRHVEHTLAERLMELSLPVRAEVTELVEALPDATLSEYMLVAHPRRLRLRGESWEESEGRSIGDAERVLRLLRDAESITDRLDTWARWRDQAAAVVGKQTYSPVVGMALERAANADPAETAGWLAHLIDTRSCLLGTAVPALAVIFRSTGDGQQLAETWGSHVDAEIRALVAMALPGIEGERPLLERLADDEEQSVRDAVLGSIRYAPDLAAWRIDTALRAARSDHTRGLSMVLSLLDRAAYNGNAKIELTVPQLDRACKIVLDAAARERLYDAHELASILKELAPGRPRIALEWLEARIAWLQQFEREQSEGTVETYLRVEPVPAEIIAQLAQTADDAVLNALLELYDSTSANSLAAADLVNAIAAIDHGSELVTQRLIEWLTRDQDGDRYRVTRVLETPLDWEQFTERARRILARAGAPDVVEALGNARLPMSWSGSRIPHLQAVRARYASWGEDADQRLADAGRQAVAQLDRTIAAERERETAEDDDWRWLLARRS